MVAPFFLAIIDDLSYNAQRIHSERLAADLFVGSCAVGMMLSWLIWRALNQIWSDVSSPMLQRASENTVTI